MNRHAAALLQEGQDIDDGLDLQERSVLGAALLGAIAADMMPDCDASARAADHAGFKQRHAHVWRTARVFEPDERAAGAYEEGYRKYLALHPAMKEAGVYCLRDWC